MTTYTINVTDEQMAALTAIVTTINNSRPLDEEGNPVGDAITEQTYLLNRIQDVLNSYVKQQVTVEADVIKEAYINATAADKISIKDAATAIAIKVDGGLKK